MRQSFKGILKEVYPAETVGDKKTKKVTALIHKPARRDEFGETIGYPDNFEVSVFNDRIKEEFLRSAIDQKVEVTAFLNSFEYEDTHKDNKKRHGLTLNLSKLDVIKSN